jgi:uncharacterized membrane protein
VNLALRVLFLAALVVWVGEIVFFSFVVAPAIFGTLPTAVAGEAVGAIFPGYYGVGLGAGAVLIGSSLVLAVRLGLPRRWLLAGGLGVLMVSLTLYAALIIQPRITVLRPQLHSDVAGESVRPEFDRLHRRAVQLNGLTLLLGLGLIGVTAGMVRD